VDRRSTAFSLDEEGSGGAGASCPGSVLDLDLRADREPDACEEAAAGGGGGGAGLENPEGSIDRSMSLAAAALMGSPELAITASALETASRFDPRGRSDRLIRGLR